MANRKYILTIEYDPKSEEIEFIQEEIIPDKDDLDIPDGYSLMKKDLVDMWESDALEFMKMFYGGDIGES